MLRLSQLVLVFVFALNQANSNAHQKLLITVYYESLCPDSKNFVLQQLEPGFSLLHKYLTIKFVPFGKARSIDNGRRGFQCQHGPYECAGNLMQSCALDLMQRRDDVEKISYVACEMKTEAGSKGDFRCVRAAGIRTDIVEQCVNSDRGVGLQLNEERLTNYVRPSFIPTITIGGVFNQDLQNGALEDFVGTVCLKLGGVPECADYFNAKALRYVLY